MNPFIDKIAVMIATACGSGFAPKAPGTVGSLFAIPLIWYMQSLQLIMFQKFIIIVAISIVGLWATARVEKLWHTHDDGRIVIDEVAGMFLTLAWFPFDLLHVVVGFALFRLFDIWKPGPIGYVDETWPGAYGTFFDDVVAGVFAAGALWAISSAMT